MTRQRVAAAVQAAAVVVVVAVAVVITLQCWTYHRPPVAQVQAGPSPDQLAFEQHQRELLAELDALSARYQCLPPDTWTAWRSRIKQYPAHMIVQPVTAAGLPTWALVVKPWSMTNIGGYVKGLCVR